MLHYFAVKDFKKDYVCSLFVVLEKKHSNMKCVFFFKDIKQHFTSVKSVRKFLKGNQVWKCILGHIQVKKNAHEYILLHQS